MNRFAKVFIALILILSYSVYKPHEEAKAALPLVLPVGGAVAAGVYVTTALAVGGLATMVGIEYGDEINAHANRVWDGTTQAVNDSINWSVQQWETAQNGILPIGSALSNYLEAQIPGLVADIMTEYYLANGLPVDPSPTLYNSSNQRLGISQGTSTVRMTMSTSTFQSGNLFNLPSNFFITFESTRIAIGSSSSGYWYLTHSATNYQELNNILKQVTSVHAAVALVNSYATNGYIGLTGQTTDFQEKYNTGVSSTREAWQDMKDAGLVLPNTGITTYTGDTLVNYNAQTDTWQGVDGNVYNPSDLTWKFPTVRTREGTADIPAGTYVDSPTLTGNPAIDEALINNPAIPKTTTNVQTGVGYANPDIATEAPPTTGTTPKIDKVKPRAWAALITTKFPFSLPWDLFFILSFLNADPKTPEWGFSETMSAKNGSLVHKEQNLEVSFSLAFLDPYIGWFRSFIVLGFAFFLVMNTRRLLGGAQ